MRDYKAKQIKSIILLVIILFQTLFPTTALALADSPSQPEFESYEEFGTSDMVDLSTGDFTYNIPLLSIPSPEGGFQVPLSYHSGIELNEEASWVGLGWNVNPGAITRRISAFPDDYNGESVNSTISNPGGSGYIDTDFFHTEYYDSQKGYSGVTSLFGIIDFNDGAESSVGIPALGLTFKDGKASYDPNYMIQGLTNMAYLAAQELVPMAGIAISAMSVMNNCAEQLTGAHTTLSNKGYQLSSMTTGKGILGLGGKHIDYKWNIKEDKTENEFGTLYMHNMPLGATDPNRPYNTIKVHNEVETDNPDLDGDGTADNVAKHYDKEAVSDMYYHYGSGEYRTTDKPFGLSYDNYSVKGAGITGSIKPYRHDMGMLSNSGEADRYTLASIRYSDYKVQFHYLGDPSNSYSYQHIGSDDLETNSFPYEIDGTQFSPALHINVMFHDQKVHMNYNGDYRSGKQVSRNDGSLYNNRLVHGRHIEWFSNYEVTHLNSNGHTQAQDMGFMNTHQTYYRNSQIPKQIAGFSITNESGITYHYSIPVYNKSTVSGSQAIAESNSSDITTTITKDNNPYAVAWLLTGITGPDFIDRDADGAIDDEDWGYWVKFEYGKFADSYAWRNPYNDYYRAGTTRRSMQTGVKETYYLNRISTRTHSALFVTDRRFDGKSYYDTDDHADNFINNYRQAPSESLRLSDIYLLSNDDYNKLIAPASQGGYALTLNHPSTNTAYANNGDTYSNVLDVLDIGLTSGANSFLSQNQLQKIHFNHSYRLCQKTFNSFSSLKNSFPQYSEKMMNFNYDSLKGKLTLESIDILAKNNARVMPGYIFSYGNSNATDYNDVTGHNPDYEPDRFDGNGMYKPGGISLAWSQNHTRLSKRNCEPKGDQWCLTDIVTPLSSTIHVEYERDDYANVNGYPLNQAPMAFEFWMVSGNSILLVDGPQAGTAVTNIIPVNTPVYYYYTPAGGTDPIPFYTQVRSVEDANHITLADPAPGAHENRLYVIPPKKYGGGVRTKSLTTIDELNNHYTTKYFYTRDGTASGISSGVASYEAEGEKATDFDFYYYHQHPYTSIIYSNVTVVTGDVSQIFNEKSKTTYHFVTPHHDLVNVSSNAYHLDILTTYDTRLLQNNLITVDKTAIIGSVDTIKAYNKFGHLTGKTVFEYDDFADNSFGSQEIGCYTENNLLWEILEFRNNMEAYVRFLQSYVLTKPCFLKSVTTYKDRIKSKTEYTKYDYLTGQKLTTKNTYGGAESFETEIEPAYNHYNHMGSKALDYTNKNMMSAVASSTDYAYDQSGVRQILASTANTWKNTYVYKDLTTSGYQNNTNPTSASTPYQDAWLREKTYVWKSLVKENGSVLNFSAFNRNSSTQSSNWIKTSEVSQYDRYSHILESADINGVYKSQKYGFNQSYLISACPAARYDDWCYSGAEDKTIWPNHYADGVEGGQYQYSSSIFAHTGSYCSRIQSGNKAFAYSINMPHLDYGASVWVHQNGAQHIRLLCKALPGGQTLGYCNYNTGYTGSNVNAASEYMGSFYKLNLTVPSSIIPNDATSIIFEVSHIGTTAQYAYADDFRVFPLKAPITANVVDPKTGRVVAVLNEDNMATKFIYDASGKLINTYKETRQGFKMVSDIKYNYNR